MARPRSTLTKATSIILHAALTLTAVALVAASFALAVAAWRWALS